MTINGLTYLRARNYDSATGTFTTADPLDGVDGTAVVANPYHYAGNDPSDRTDPRGLRSSDCDMSVAYGLNSQAQYDDFVAKNYDASNQEFRALANSQNTGSCILEANTNGAGQIVESYGNLQAATNIAIAIDGTGQNIGNNTAEPHAMNLRDAASTLAGSGTTATIAWLGYDSPGNPVAGLGWGAAEGGGRSLTDFVARLRRNFSGKRITIVGHSYGSAVVSEAMKDGVSADDAVETGTFGGGINVDSVAETGYGGHLYVGHAADDTAVGIGEITHGPNQASYPDVRMLDVGGASGHNQYYDRGSTSLQSIAAVVVGRVGPTGSEDGIGRPLWGLQ